jgi:MFS family permease
MAVEEVHHDGAVRSYSTEKHDVEYIDVVPDSPSPTALQNADEESVAITWKTWFVIFVLSSTFGLSFWPVPTTAALQGKLSLQFKDPTSMAWYVPAYTSGNAIGFLIAGANSDLFGRRLFLLFGNVCCCVGFIITAMSDAAMQFTAGLAITGFGGGFCKQSSRTNCV